MAVGSSHRNQSCPTLLGFLMGAPLERVLSVPSPSCFLNQVCFISSYHPRVLETHWIIDQFWNSLLLWLYSFYFLRLRYSPLMIKPVLVILQFIPPGPLSLLLTNLGGWPLWAVLPELFAFWLLLGLNIAGGGAGWGWYTGSIGRRWKTGGSEIFSFFFFAVPIFLCSKPQLPNYNI